MRRILLRFGAAAVLMLGGCARSLGPGIVAAGAGALPSDVFVALDNHGAGDTGGGSDDMVSLFSVASGARVRDLFKISPHVAVELAGFTIGSDGDVWYALANNPRYPKLNGNPSGVSHGPWRAPLAGTCGGGVYRIDHQTGNSRRVFTVSGDWILAGPAPSPDNRSVAYSITPCTAEYGGVVVVRNLASGSEHQISVEHEWVRDASWSMDGRRLALRADPADRSWNPEFAIVNADGGAFLPATVVRHAPDKACEVEHATFDRDGLVLIEGCPSVVSSESWITQLDPEGRNIMWRAKTTVCPNGALLSAGPTGEKLLLSGQQGCHTPTIIDTVQIWDHGQSRVAGTWTTPAEFVSEAKW